jgi:tetratricopeptide (TPR) repeat protein
MRNSTVRAALLGCSIGVAAIAGATLAGAQASESGKVPITTASGEARDLYAKGRDLAEKLRATDARQYYEQAVAKDPEFGLGYVGLANTATTNREFIEAVKRAVTLAGRVSAGERHMILALDEGLKGNPTAVLKHYTELVRLHPGDERAHNLLGNTYFGRQEYEAAVTHYVRATSINPAYSQPYNQLGYAYRFLDRFDEAETAFKKYVQLIPTDPNPYDSHAELLMKMGRFEESIKAYEKALSIDPKFVASYVGIGNNHLAAGRPEQARAAFARIDAVARNTGERRLARFWTAASWVHEGATDKALAELKALHALAEAAGDGGNMSGDLNLMGDVLREAGRLDEAAARYAESVVAIEKAQVPEEVKQGARRNLVFEEGRLAAERKDLATAKAKAAEYERLIAPRQAPFEIRQHRELAGMIALAENRPADAAQEFARANQQDPKVLYLSAIAWRKAGDTAKSARFATKAAKFNGLAFNYAYVRTKAQSLGGTTTN